MKLFARTATIMAIILIITVVKLPLPVIATDTAVAADTTVAAFSADGMITAFSADTTITAYSADTAEAVEAMDAASTSFTNYERAVDLKILGLMANSPENFELERAPTRIEGAIMLVRLLGKEKQAKQSSYTHPFTDVPAWADFYVGYLYQNKLTMGVGGSRFAPYELMSAKQYITFVLRSIGYEDKIDFDYDKSIEKAIKIGLLSTSEGTALKNSGTFIRNDMAGISYNALSLNLKASHQTLLDKLVNADKAVYKTSARVLGLYTSDLKSELTIDAAFSPAITQYGSIAKNSEDLFKLIRATLYSYQTQLTIDIQSYGGSIKEDADTAFRRAIASVEEITGAADFVASWKYSISSTVSSNGVSSNYSLNMTIQYRYAKSDFIKRQTQTREALNKARYIVATLIKNDMLEYEKEKNLHDYIINNCRYDYQNYLKGTLSDESFDEYGCLVRKTAVCEGYSRAMKLLCDLSALECIIISGKSKSNGSSEGHSWNIVRIDGAYYHLDVTNNDPVTKNGSDILVYYYFNLPDSEMALSSTWNTSEYPACTSVENNYYYRNNMTVSSKAGFEQSVRNALERRKTTIDIKVSGYSKDRYSNLSDIVFSLGTVSEFRYSTHDDLGIINIYDIKYF